MYSYGKSFVRHKKCVVCGKAFDTQSPSTKTCSEECSMINKNNYKKVINENNKRYYSHSRKNKNKEVK
jgi:predicted nucleic acid-binding Zn ribbon protein